MKHRVCGLCFGDGFFLSNHRCVRCHGSGAVLDVPDEALPAIYEKIMEVKS